MRAVEHAKEHKTKGLPRNTLLILTMVIILVYYFVSLGFPLIRGNLCVSSDFCGYYSAGQIWNEIGSSQIYDPENLRVYQDKLFVNEEYLGQQGILMSMIYLPIFLFPFRLFALVDLPLSLFLWDLINFLVLILYLVYFIKKVSHKKPGLLTLGLILISYPIFRNFLDGQVNLLLLICAGEFLRALLSGKPIQSGLWLGGWLIKPQILILILPFLLLQKKFKVLMGFVISSIVIVGISFLMVGWEGFMNLMNGIMDVAGGNASSSYQYMMNWRAFAFYFSIFPNPIVGKIVFWVGTIGTTIVPFWVFRKKMESNSPEFAVALLGIITATTAVTYHAHHHMAMIIIPCLLYLYLNGWLEKKLFLFWVLAPTLTIMVQYALKARVALLDLPLVIPVMVLMVYGLSMLVPNLVLLGWAIKKALKWKKDLALKSVG